ESKDTGAIKSSVFFAYIKNYGTTAFVWVTVVALVFTQVTRLANDIWLVSWTQNSYPWLTRNEYMGTYASLGVSQALALLIYSILFAVGGLFAAKSLHDQVLARAVGSPVGFFDQTPMGRIVNRLSRDIDYADNSIYDAMRLFFYSCLQLLATFGLVCYFTKGLFAIVLIPMLAIYYFIQLVYRTSSREIKRIESVSRSPLSGLSTIRAYREQDRFIDRTQKLVDTNSAPLYLLYTGQRWIQLRLETIGNLLVFAVGMYAAAERMGLALSYLLQTTSLLNMAIFQAVEVEVQLNAIERLVEYTDLAIEEPPTLKPPEPPKAWPTNGSITFNKVQMRYHAGLPLVLKGISFEITGGQKIGVVGRTGSGKSSLMQALFRMVTIEGGSIIIDGIDISTIPLKSLRSRLAIIPQDPVLFSGTVRENLDPTNIYNDSEIWAVLERCSMKEAVSSMEGKLEAELVENGENISVGQRQLMCLARAVLQKPKVIILDECTASVDMETDAIIQNTIRNEFADATTLTIAHRLNTIITSDKILYLSHGVTEEFDSPYNLLIERPDSSFAKLVAEAGDAMASSLRAFLIEKHAGSNVA
ncbi:Multidrug resistance-associated protein 1, partial [Blyttiomyces sp. JEL0837]